MSPKYTFKAEITLKKSIFDPQAETINSKMIPQLVAMGNVENDIGLTADRVGQLIIFSVESEDIKQARIAAKAVLELSGFMNPVMHESRISAEALEDGKYVYLPEQDLT